MTLYVGSSTEGQHAAAHLVSEVNEDLSREMLAIPANTPAMEAGTVVVAAGGTYAAFTGAEADLAILFDNVPLDAVNAQEAVITRHLSVVNDSDLIWPAGITAPQKDAAIADLWTRYVQVKTPAGPTISGALA